MSVIPRLFWSILILLSLYACAADTTDFRATKQADGGYELALPQTSFNAGAETVVPMDALVSAWGKKLCGKEYRVRDAGIRKRPQDAYPERIWYFDCTHRE